MKRILALMTAAVMLLSLCACGKKKPEPAPSDGVSQEEAEKEPVVKVDLTMANFYDYFYYKEFHSAAKSEKTGEINSMQILYGFVLKDGYTAETSPLYDSNLKVVFTATGVMNQGDFTVDFNTLEYTGNITGTDIIDVEEELVFWPKGNRTEIWAFGNYNRSYIMYLTDFRVKSVSGCIYLKNDF